MASEPEKIEGEERHVTRRELKLELRLLDRGITLKLVLAVVLLRFHIPTEITAPALGLVAVKSALTFASRH